MTKFVTLIASTSAAILLAGNAFAASPAAGNYPQFSLFDAASTMGPMAQRAQVQMEAARHWPASGEKNTSATPTTQRSGETRAEVAQTTREAIAHGYVVKSGEQS